MEAFEKSSKTQLGDKSLDHEANSGSEAVVVACEVDKSWENGVRVSINGKVAPCLDEEGDGLENPEMNGVSSLLQMKENFRNVDVNGGTENAKEYGTLLGEFNKSKKIGAEKVFPSGDDDGVSLVDVHGKDMEIDGKERMDLDNMENGGGVMGSVNEIEGTKEFGTVLADFDRSKEIGAEKVVPSGDDSGVSLVDVQGKAMEIDGKEEMMDLDNMENDGWVMESVNEIEDGDLECECEFRAGDFVWGKIWSHPWWPGRVYNPSDASDYAVNVRQMGRLLVAYYGDSSFAWCHPSQLKCFEDNFEEMSKLSSSKNFLNALHASIDEIGGIVESKMTCSCVPKENCAELDRPLVANAGIKEGVLVPECGIRKLSNGVFEPEEILGKLKQCAQAVSMSNLLECSVLKGWLSAFKRSIGQYQMPVYHESLPISCLEENVSTLVVDMSEYNEVVEVPTTGPVEVEWISSFGGLQYGQRGQTLFRCPEISEDGLCEGRKQKSIAEIMKGELDVQAGKDEDVAQKGTNSGEQVSSSKKKTKGNNKANVVDGSSSSSIPRKRKESELSGSLAARKSEKSSVETDDIVAKEEMGKGYSSMERKKKSKGASNDNNDSGGREDTNDQPVSARRKVNVGSGIAKSDAETKDLIECGSLLRERKKSKYLSPPYISQFGTRKKMYMEAESSKVSNDSQLGEPMTKASGNLVRSPLVLSCSDEGDQFHEVHAEQEAINASGFRTLSRMIDLEKVKTPTNEVLIEIRSVALSPQYQRKNKSFGTVVEFLSAFRSCVYWDGFNYKTYDQFLLDQNLTDHFPSAYRSNQEKVGKSVETKMDLSKHRQATSTSPKKKCEKSKACNHKIKQAARAVAMKKNDKEVFENASSAAILFVTFGPGSSLPTKDDLIQIYSRYGSLDTEGTYMFYNNFCARVVFLRSSDAEQAFNSSQSDSPFGTSDVSFQLRFPSGASAHDLREIPAAIPSPLAKCGAERSKNSLASQNSADQTSQLSYIRSKLEMVISVLEISDEIMSPDIKSKLLSEIEGILEKVNTMVDF